jgi:hypothetical protein
MVETTAYALVEGGEEAWLLVAGSVATRDEAAARLRQAGVTVLRSGPWLGESAEGIEADWFVRFLRPATAEPLAKMLERVIGQRAPGPPAAGELRLRLVEAQLAAARARETTMQAENERLRETLREPALDAVVQALRVELAEERALRQAADASATAANEALILAAGTRVQRAVTATATVTPVGRRVPEEVQTVLAALLPRVRLLRDSLTIACGEFGNRQALYRACAELQQSSARLPPAWKKLQGVDAWWEQHISNGEDDAGRLYTRLDRTDLCWEVLLSHKGEQARDIAWLKRQ